MQWPRLWSTADEKHQHSKSILEQPEVVSTGIIHDEQQNTSKSGSPSLPTTKTNLWRSFREPETILATAIMTTACLASFTFYKTFLRRISEAPKIPESYFRKKSILGKVTSVGDGDNFRIYHTPGGWLAGWGWLPWRRVPVDKRSLKGETIHIRIAGIDAPECSHFGRPAQPYSQEALAWLTSYLKGKRVRAYVHRADQYSRVVATVYVWKGLLRRDVGLQMLRSGLAGVYEAKTGVEFGEGLEEKYRSAERWAKLKRKGMWFSKTEVYESPREYKNRYKTQETTSKS